MVKLTPFDHSRDSAGLTYVYPVLSRRAGGLSVGINLNPNNACNWRCIYCQVPNLRRGTAPEIDLARLSDELCRFLEDVLHGDFFRRYEIGENQRRIRDIAISGNGEPTSAHAFPDVVETIGRAVDRFALREDVKKVLITNGSLVGRHAVQQGIARWAELGGEVWFKIDRVTRRGLAQINQVEYPPGRLARNLAAAARRCPTWLQTCLFALDGRPPEEAELQSYVDFVAARLQEGLPLCGVLLYGLARPSLQPEAPRLSALPADWMEAFGARVRALGLPVTLSL